MIIREMQKKSDIEQISDLDASFSTQFIYQVVVKSLSVQIIEEKLAVSFQKSYQPWNKNDIDNADCAIVAEIDGKIVGFATVKYEEWNKRAILSGIFVALNFKEKGVGRALIDSVINHLKSTPARGLWVETQNINYPAIQFYIKLGFEFCGFDNTLYNPDETASKEVAFYFYKNL